MNQFAIALFGLTAMWCAMSRNDRARKWAPFIGLAGQPFWLWETWGSWGMFIVSCGYTIVFVHAIWQRSREMSR